MARAKLRFKESDVARLLRAAAKAKLSVGRVMVDRDDNLVLIASQPGDVIEAKPSDDLDRELQEFEARHGEAGR
jgi:hypothetical protein